MAIRKFGTCFFEQYAQISLSALLGSEFDCLVNRDRPDLQSTDGHSLGIEVTRAMEESKTAHLELLKDVAGITPAGHDEEIDQILEYGYSYGLREGKYIGVKELSYWSMALPLRRIIASKVNKCGGGLYGRFDRMGLFVFCKDSVTDMEVIKTLHYTMNLQKYLEICYNRLYLAEAGNLYVCNLDDGLSESARLIKLPITQQQRRDFYLEAVRRQYQGR
jgi:hypothetical protein